MKQIDVREMSPVISDNRVREVRTAISDSGKVCMGAFSPAFPPPVRHVPIKISDGGKVRMGAFSPAFPQLRSR